MSEEAKPISYQRCRVSATYEESGPVDYNGFVARLAGGDYLLHWENTIIWRFEDARYDHIEMALDSLDRADQLKTRLAHKPAAAADNPTQAWAVFLSDQANQALANDLVSEGFADYYRPRPDQATHDCYVATAARLGQRLLEDWLG